MERGAERRGDEGRGAGGDAVFTYLGARSGSLIAAVVAVLVVETTVLHLLLVSRYPAAAWTLTGLGALSLAWIAVDYRAMATGRVRLLPDAIDVRIGRGLRAHVPRSLVVSAISPSWRDIPERPDGYLNATMPAEPNVLLTLAEPVAVRRLGIRQRARVITLHLDEPSRFLAALEADAER